MFETLFSRRKVLRRHREGPLCEERVAYLQRLASRGLARNTLCAKALHCLAVAVAVSRHPPERLFAPHEVGPLLITPHETRDALGKPVASRSAERLHCAAIEFLDGLGRLRPDPPRARGEHDGKLAAFLAHQRETRWQARATCQTAEGRIRTFLDHLHQRGLALHDVAAEDIDVFCEAMAARWSRPTLAHAASALRQWLEYGGRRGWVRPGLYKTVRGPRLHPREGLPIGPSRETVARMIDAVGGAAPAAVRDRAILLLLAIYGVRSGEVRRLRLDDIDWTHDRIVFERSKSRRREEFVLHPLVGEAIVRYLRAARPPATSRCVFLTARAPYRPLTAGTVYSIVRRRYPAGEEPPRGRGPHGLRHACARHLVESGYSFKQVGDFLGHRSPDSTGVYAKVDLRSLREVAPDDLGGLA